MKLGSRTMRMLAARQRGLRELNLRGCAHLNGASTVAQCEMPVLTSSHRIGQDARLADMHAAKTAFLTLLYWRADEMLLPLGSLHQLTKLSLQSCISVTGARGPSVSATLEC